MKSYRGAVLAAVVGLLALGVAACGSSSSASGSGSASASTPGALPLKSGENPVGQTLYGKKRGGTLTVYSSEDFEHLDPGEAYFVADYAVMYATQRPLFVYPPNSATTLVPDLATAVPTVANGGITNGGLTVTVHIQPNVRFSPPVNRVVTSADVAYAIERGANPNVANPYFVPYFGDLVGAASAKGGPIPGISTPNSTTIVFKLTKPTASVLIGALSLPLSAPVPESFAGPMDKHSPTTYGSSAEVATGPYMIEANPTTGVFAGLGYQTGKSLTLVRNPNWDPSSYTSLYKPPAYLDRINVNIGEDATVIGQQVLKGSESIQLDTPAQSIVEDAYENYPSQITFTPGSGTHYGGLDTQHGPFVNVDLRRAVWAAVDREAIVKARGGSLVAAPLTHFLTPGTDGYLQAGGAAGPSYPWNADLDGNLAVAQKYMKLAGYPSGKYTGTDVIQVVAGNNSNAPAIALIIVGALNELGFKTHLSEVDQSVMYAKYCGVPKQEIDVCPSSGWNRDFDNPLTVLYVPFNGAAITSTNNVNWSQLNDPQINAAMNKAALIINPTQAAQAWANIDKQLVYIAAGLPETFDSQANIESSDVAGVNQLWDNGEWDFQFTSLKNP
ncbi:MAG: ABC transporter substrate-binding protein [Solirubrobacteraceae bacterium]